MLSREQKRYSEMYAYRAGMLNNVWLAGFARLVTKTGGFIQQTDNLNHMIPFTLAKGDVMPGWVKNGAAVKINGRMHGDRLGNEPIVLVRAIAFEQPSIIDMPARELFDHIHKQGIPVDDTTPRDGLPELAQKMDGFKINDTGNMARIAGFVSGFVVEAPGTIQADGKPSNGCIILTLRQTDDANDVIPIRCYGSKASVIGRRLDIGWPIFVEGQLKVRVKETGEPAGIDGLIPVRKYLYLHTNMLKVAQQDQITSEPEWAKAMVLDHRSKRQAEREEREKANQIRQLAKLEADMATRTAAAPENTIAATHPLNSAVMPATPAAAPTTDVSLDAINPALLAKFNKKPA